MCHDGIVTPIAFRPFDTRWTYNSGNSCGWVLWPREKKTMGHLLKEPTSPIGQNVALVYPKETNKFWDGAFISNSILDAHCIDYPGRSIAYSAPLYLYSEIDNTWTPNLNHDHLQNLTQYLDYLPSPIEVFDYCYGVLYDPVYRKKYNAFLKRDFPRIPVIENEEIFRTYVNAGERLRKLHLMQIKVPAPLTLEPNTSDGLEIETVKYKGGKLHLNANKRILAIPDDVWNYRIGGYQVIDKWLKSHKGKTMTIDDFEHIENIVGLLAETIKIQEELRKLH